MMQWSHFEHFPQGFHQLCWLPFFPWSNFNFLMTQQAALDQYCIFSSFNFGLALHLLFFFSPLRQIKNLSLPKGKTLKTLNCIFFQTILDWCVMLCHITLGNSCLLACTHQWTSENDGLNWTRNIRMQCDSSWTSFFDVLQQMLPVNTNMKTFRSCLQTKLDTSKFKYKMI